MIHNERATIAAAATPPGEGGIAIVRVSGAAAAAIAARIFRPLRPGNPTNYPGYTVHYGQFVDLQTGEVADEGLLTVFRAPRSYTGEDVIELACHGGRVTTARVLALALQAGARLAEPGEFTQRAFLNGRLDLAQAEAVADIIRARTDAAQRLARRQLDGALSQAVLKIKDELVGILAAIEVTIDFSEEVGDLDYAALLLRLSATRREIEALLATAERGRILREGLRVAIVGRPNVGKSSLLNALLRAERAIVTPIAGTTRDLLEESANLAGIPVVLTDTAGLRETSDVVERIGVERASAAAAQADVTLFVLDATAGYTPEDAAIAAQLATESAGRLLMALNKRDAVTPEQIAALLPRLAAVREGAGYRASGVGTRLAEASFAPAGIVPVSAQTGEGLDALEQQIAAMAAGQDSVHPDSVVVANARHRQALEAALRSLQEAERTTNLALPGDFIAIDVRGALDSIGQITGETVTEDIIHRIFHDFCVGK